MKMNIKKTITVLALLAATVVYANQPSFKQTLSLQGLVFDVVTIGEGSLRQLTIQPTGLTGVNELIKQEIDGSVVGAEVADLNQDGFAEIYVYISSTGSGGYGSLVAHSSNLNKSITPMHRH
ncbi:MAG: hypothetical protein HF962_07000 [Sulfurovum sp.]|nr:hypothetical protein [Sulfurovum sp.]